ncbi:hypothetical protein SS209_04590 [Salmonella enterica subsp. enterica serovar Senftenberg str. SS209]|nr:hypothetical protein SS209_04590 [Salmonella enterica subsp. enterica serovar Senftenberg str. SS209]
MSLDIALDHFCRQVMIDPHQQRAIIVTWRPERSGIKTSIAISAAIVETRQFRIRGIVANLTLQ